MLYIVHTRYWSDTSFSWTMVSPFYMIVLWKENYSSMHGTVNYDGLIDTTLSLISMNSINVNSSLLDQSSDKL